MAEVAGEEVLEVEEAVGAAGAEAFGKKAHQMRLLVSVLAGDTQIFCRGIKYCEASEQEDSLIESRQLIHSSNAWSDASCSLVSFVLPTPRGWTSSS